MAVIVSDSFNRANASSLGTAETGQPWITYYSSWAISNNQAKHVSGEDGIAVVESGVADCTISAKIMGGPEGRGIVFRQTNSTEITGWQLQYEQDRINLYLRSEGWTSQGFYEIYVPNIRSGAVLKVVLLGSSIKVYLDDLLIISKTSTIQMTATRHGLGTWQDGPTFDDFKVETIEAAPTLVKNGEYRITGSVLPIYSLASIPTANQLRTYHPTKGISCFELVPVTDAKASKVRVNVKGTVKAIKKE